MGRFTIAITFLLLLSACASSANAPTVQLSATLTATPPPKSSSFSMCEGVELPAAVLSYGGQEQASAKVATNWRAEDCAFSVHPSFTLPLPDTPLRVPLGGSPLLEFSIEPIGGSGYTWKPDFAAAEQPEFDQVQVPLDDLRASTRVDISVEPSTSQRLDLSMLSAGDYAIEVSAGWEDGQSGWAFRIQIVGP